jgi:aminoglycoside phosphotransferase (APT) family kinase protein
MSERDSEHLLVGGFMNTVVRIGATVRRTAGDWTPTVQRLLTHVRERGLDWAPQPLGFDEQGREVLTFIEGEVPHEMPPWVWSDEVLAGAVHALRRWHDASMGFDLAGARWRFGAQSPSEVICHSDFAPYNCVFRDKRFVAAIDFDTCCPGPRLWDLGYTAYRFVPLTPPRGALVDDGGRERSPFELAQMWTRVRRFLDGYAQGRPDLLYCPRSLIDMSVRRLEGLAQFTAKQAAGNQRSPLFHHAAMYRAHALWLAELDVSLCPAV